jgi:hypothetical protein
LERLRNCNSVRISSDVGNLWTNAAEHF